MNWVDLVIVVAAIAYAIGGYRNGAVVGLFSLAGFFGGNFDALLARVIEILNAFPTLVLVLVVRPTGILGERIGRAA